MNHAKKWTTESLALAVKQSDSWSGTMRLLGLAITGHSLRTLRKDAEASKIDYTHFTGRQWAKNKPKSFSQGWVAVPLNEIMIVGSSYKTGHLRQRLFKEGLREQRCQSCGLSEWQGKQIPLELDHINGISNDHRNENLRVLCPNCHAQTPTWGNRKRV